MANLGICHRCSCFFTVCRVERGLHLDGKEDKWGCIRVPSNDGVNRVSLNEGSDVPDGCLYRVEQLVAGQKIDRRAEI